MPEQVKRAAELVVQDGKGSGKGRVVEDGEGRVWLVRAVSGKAGDFGVLAIDFGPQPGLKHMHNLSDEALCERWVENPYFQYFCGEVVFRHSGP